MKKALLIVILIMVVTVSVFSESQTGIQVGYEKFRFFEVEGINTGNYGQTKIPVMLNGAFYGKEPGGLGIEYGIGGIFLLNTWQDNISISPNGISAGWVCRLGLNYRHQISNLFGMLLGLGVYGTYDSEDTSENGTTYRASEIDLFLYGKVGLDLTFGESFRFDLGAQVGGPIWAYATITAGTDKASGDISMSGITFIPYVGLSYVY